MEYKIALLLINIKFMNKRSKNIDQSSGKENFKSTFF